MAAPRSIVLPPFTEGDTWEGFTVQITNNGNPMPVALAEAKMQFRRAPGSNTGARFTSEPGGGIIIDDAAGWEMTIPSRNLPGMTPGTWQWDLQTTDEDGSIQTFLRGTIEVLTQITK